MNDLDNSLSNECPFISTLTEVLNYPVQIIFCYCKELQNCLQLKLMKQVNCPDVAWEELNLGNDAN